MKIIKIVVDEIPESCYECPFGKYGVCCDIDELMQNDRNSDCPLQEENKDECV